MVGDAGRAFGAGHVDNLDDGQDIFFDREFPKHGRFLRQVADAVASPLVHRQAREITAVERDGPGGRGHQPHDHVECGGLARAVAAEQPDDLARPNAQVYAVDHVAGAERLDQTGGDNLGAYGCGCRSGSSDGGRWHHGCLGEAAGAGSAAGWAFFLLKPRSLIAGRVKRPPTPSSGSIEALRSPR